MKFTLSWLLDHIDTDKTAQDLASTMTRIGLEVEALNQPSEVFTGFVTARVTESRTHPSADRLHVCTVHDGTNSVSVVCGAPNVRTGMIGVFAPPGATLPGTGAHIEAKPIRGVDSCGMLCSERELALSDEHDEIIELPADTPIGMPFVQAMEMDDPIFHVAITPNRGDCLGVRGIARDIAASGVGEMKPLDAPPISGVFISPLVWRREHKPDPHCPAVGGIFFRNVSNDKPSPRWLARRLQAAGMRPISALVDITNYIACDLGRPLHMFDADHIAGDTLTMRKARKGESLRTLDGKQRRLDNETTIIADERRALAIGGIMGGEETSCTNSTRNAFLESALFDPLATALTGRRLQIKSEASYRFERGVAPSSLEIGLRVAARLVGSLCGGEVSEPVFAGKAHDKPRSVSLRFSRLSSLGGQESLSPHRAAHFLQRLGCRIREQNAHFLQAEPPDWRPDITTEACLVEEILRLDGLDRVPSRRLSRAPVEIDMRHTRKNQTRRALAMRGLDETISWSFIDSRLVAHFTDEETIAFLRNPISSELDAMRPSVLFSLAISAARNRARTIADCGFFELGACFALETASSPQEKKERAAPKKQQVNQTEALAALRLGNRRDAHWSQPARQADAWDARADLLAAIEKYSGKRILDKLTTHNGGCPRWFHPGRSAALMMGRVEIAHFGELHPDVPDRLNTKGRMVGFELFLEALPEPKKRAGARPPLERSALQAVWRDFAFIVPATMPAEQLVRAAKSVDRKLIADIEIFDVWQDPAHRASGEKSLALRVKLQAWERSLTEKDFSEFLEKLLAKTQKIGARLRT